MLVSRCDIRSCFLEAIRMREKWSISFGVVHLHRLPQVVTLKSSSRNWQLQWRTRLFPCARHRVYVTRGLSFRTHKCIRIVTGRVTAVNGPTNSKTPNQFSLLLAFKGRSKDAQILCRFYFRSCESRCIYYST